MKILFVQPSIPLYRLSFFKSLATEFGKFFLVIHSEGDFGELTPSLKYPWSKCIGKVKKVGFGFMWQINLINFNIKREYNSRFRKSQISIYYFIYFKSKIIWG